MAKDITNAGFSNDCGRTQSAPIAIPSKFKAVRQKTSSSRENLEQEKESFFVGSPASEQRENFTERIYSVLTPLLTARQSPEEWGIITPEDCEKYLENSLIGLEFDLGRLPLE